MDKTKNYKDLIVWQKAIDLAELTYKLTSSFPKEEVYGITSQMRRCSVSIASNIAEGQARSSMPQFRQFLSISKGSLAELQTQAIIAERLKYLSSEQHTSFQIQISDVAKLLHGLIRSLKD